MDGCNYLAINSAEILGNYTTKMSKIRGRHVFTKKDVPFLTSDPSESEQADWHLKQ